MLVTKHVMVLAARTYGTGAVDPDPSVVAAPWQGYPTLLGPILPLVLMVVFGVPFLCLSIPAYRSIRGCTAGCRWVRWGRPRGTTGAGSRPPPPRCT